MSNRNVVLLACGSFNPPHSMHLRNSDTLAYSSRILHYSILLYIQRESVKSISVSNHITENRMFESARIALERQKYSVVAGWLSPVSDGYGKRGLGISHQSFHILPNLVFQFQPITESKCVNWRHNHPTGFRYLTGRRRKRIGRQPQSLSHTTRKRRKQTSMPI